MIDDFQGAGSKPSRRSFLAGAGTTVAAAGLFAGGGSSAAAVTPADARSEKAGAHTPPQPDELGNSGELHQIAGGGRTATLRRTRAQRFRTMRTRSRWDHGGRFF